MREPSTQWKETVAADEEARFARYAEQIRRVQRARDERFGTGRAFHRKGLLALDAELEVLDGLPEPARHGLFARPAKYPALVRLSNGSTDVQRDRVADIRGFAIKVLGVDGESALGGKAAAQDFALIHLDTFSFPDAAQFVAFVEAAVKGPAAIVGHFVKQHGLLGGLKRTRALMKSVGRPFSGFCSEAFHSAAPIAVGPYAAKVRLLPARAPGPPPDDFAGDVKRQLERGPLSWSLQLQFFVDEAVTPIERADVRWPESESPFVTVAKLTVSPQPFEGEPAAQRSARVEREKFDPWEALKEHRPLGDVMRARKAAYYASQQQRGAA